MSQLQRLDLALHRLALRAWHSTARGAAPGLEYAESIAALLYPKVADNPHLVVTAANVVASIAAGVETGEAARDVGKAELKVRTVCVCVCMSMCH